MRCEAIEFKVWRANDNVPLPDGLAQLDRYLDASPSPPAGS